MKTMKRLSAALLLAALCLCAFPSLSFTAFAAGTENIFYITPTLGDGATLTNTNADGLYVKGILYKNGYLTYTETRTLSFTVKLASGWTYNSKYSSVFEGDSASLVTTQGNNSVTFTYTATAGKSIKFSSLKNVCINTTASEMPKLYLNVSGSFERVSKKEWTDCNVRLELGTKQYASGNYVGSAQVKGRGNYSWQKEQKPYSINLTEKASLLDIPATHKYAIVSTIVDESLVRNLVMYQAAQDLQGIEFVVKAEPVEVYLNGEYNGIYTLTQRIRIADTKVNDTEATPDNIQGAYILEKTVTGKMSDDDVYFTVPYLTHNDTAETVVFKDPEEPSKEMQEYVKTIFDGMHDAIMSDSETAYKRYIDTSSWVDFIIMQEVSKNIDGDLKTSSFMLLNSNSQIVKFTSVWDFDLAFGQSTDDNNIPSKGVTGCPEANTTTGFMVVGASCPWFESLYEKSSFKQALMERYTEYRYTLIENMGNLINRYAAYMERSVQTKKAYVDADDVEDGVEYLQKWFKGRLSWLDKQWLLEDTASYGIQVMTSGKGSVTPTDGSNTVGNGGFKTYTIVPENGYSISKVTFDGRDVTNSVKLGTFTTPFIAEDSTLIVQFSSGSPTSGNEHTIFIDESSVGGTTTLNAYSAPAGAIIEVTATPWEGYAFKNITVGKTVLAGNTFVMPDEDVIVTAVYAETGKAEENKAVLQKVLSAAGTATVKAIANQSCQPLSDSYTTLTEQAQMLLEDEEAEASLIDGTSLELIHLVGLLARDNITVNELAVYAEVAKLCGADQSALTQATEATSDTALAAWDALTDACYPLTSISLLNSVTNLYAEMKQEEYSEASFAPFAEALEAGQKLLQDARAKQSQLDKATAELATAGRHLVKRKAGEKTSEEKTNDQNLLALKIIAVVAAVAAAAMAVAASLKIKKRRKAKKTHM